MNVINSSASLGGEILGIKIDEKLTKDHICLLYTSDAADDSLRVDLGGRRIIKKLQMPPSCRTHSKLR